MAIRVALFDIGGVLVDLPGLPGIPATDAAHQQELWQRWIVSPWVRRLESGRCSAQEFAEGMVADWQLRMTPEQYLQAFAAWPKGLYPGTAELIAGIRPGIRTGCLSNSNPVHWPRMRDEMGLGTLLDEHFLSYLMGVVKPDPQIFARVIATLAVPAGSILFLDDNLGNVTAARAAGMEAEHTVGPVAARAALGARALVADPPAPGDAE